MNDPKDLALLTDLYQLTMAQGYYQSQNLEPATFSLFIRTYPPGRGYFVSAGLEDVLRYLEEFAFRPKSIDYLHSTGIFTDEFLDFLRGVYFTGDAWAIPEGRIFFKDEPILEIQAPIIEAQLVETFVINQINLQTLIATKAARCVHAAQGRSVVDFSLRRTQGIDAGLKVGRACYIGGCAATSNVLAGKLYGIPIVGTMAHSFVTSFEDEIEAFRNFVASFPDNATLLIDTYDTLAGAAKAVRIAGEMASRGERLQGVRIDSGDLLSLASEVRRIFDEAGFKDVKIIGSGGLDEYALADLSQANAPFDSYGIGTRLGVSADAPWFDIVYKLVENNRRPRMKLSPGKMTLPGRKQVFRYRDAMQRLTKDVIALREENHQGAEPLLKKVMDRGKTINAKPSLKNLRERFSEEFKNFNNSHKDLNNPLPYSVEISPELKQLQVELEMQAIRNQINK